MPPTGVSRKAVRKLDGHERSAAAVRAVVFDVGETLVDESRLWLRWADRLGVTPAYVSVRSGRVRPPTGRSRTLFTGPPDIDVAAEDAAGGRRPGRVAQ